MSVPLTRWSFPWSTFRALESFLTFASVDSLPISVELATALAFSLGNFAFSTTALGGIGLTISLFEIFWRASLAGWVILSLACRSLLAVTAFTLPTGRRMVILIHLFDRGLGLILAGFLSHPSRVGLIPPVILCGM